jgi:prevent-host-death family protein
MPVTPKIIPISDLRQNASDVVRGVSSSREPVFITQRGRAAAVMVSMQVYEEFQHELDILRLLARGEKEIAAGMGYELEDVLKEADRFLESSKP